MTPLWSLPSPAVPLGVISTLWSSTRPAPAGRGSPRLCACRPAQCPARGSPPPSKPVTHVVLHRLSRRQPARREAISRCIDPGQVSRSSSMTLGPPRLACSCSVSPSSSWPRIFAPSFPSPPHRRCPPAPPAPRSGPSACLTCRVIDCVTPGGCLPCLAAPPVDYVARVPPASPPPRVERLLV